MTMMRKVCSLILTALLVLPVAVVHGNGGVDDPVLAGYDLVAYHSLNPMDDGVPGSSRYQTRHNGYLYYFANQANLDTFRQDPETYLPAYGGFCAWGVAWEYERDGWPWDFDHMGPPCGPRDGWALLTDTSTGKRHLFCSIWRSYQDDFNSKQLEGIRLANERWIDWYGSLTAGPKNNGCYAWNWQTCFANSIYDPSNPVVVANDPTMSPTMAPTQAQTLFDPSQANVGLTTVWSDPVSSLGGALTFSWTLEGVDSIRPLLIVDLLYELDDEELPLGNEDNFYLGFGVAEQVMQGALVVCSPTDDTTTSVAKAVDGGASVSSTCKTYLGSGMGITEPNTDPVQPTVLESDRNETHYRVRFSANLFACWSNPVWPARVLFSRGLVSGHGDPMPHLNNAMHRQAISGVEFLSVIEGANVTYTSDSPPEPLELEPLATDAIVPVVGTAGSMDVLEGRVTVEYELYQYTDEKEEVVHVHLNNVKYDPLEDEDQEHTYIGFGFATDTMSGLIMTCAPSAEYQLGSDGVTLELNELIATCYQWRGLGTNLYPRALETDAGGWFLSNLEGNGTHVNYTLAGRVSDVLEGTETLDGRLASDTNLRAVLAIGRTAPDTGTPLMHTSRDRTPLVLEKLASSAQGSVAQLKTTESTSVSRDNTSGSGSASPVVQALGFIVGVAVSFLNGTFF